MNQSVFYLYVIVQYGPALKDLKTARHKVKLIFPHTVFGLSREFN